MKKVRETQIINAWWKLCHSSEYRSNKIVLTIFLVKFFKYCSVVLTGILTGLLPWNPVTWKRKIAIYKGISFVTSRKGKGYFQRLTRDVKSEIVHQLQRCGKFSSHGYYLMLQLERQDGRRKQCMKGVLYLHMIKRTKLMTHVETRREEENDITDSEESINNEVDIVNNNEEMV